MYNVHVYIHTYTHFFKPIYPNHSKSVLKSVALSTSVWDIYIWMSHKSLEFILPIMNSQLSE